MVLMKVGLRMQLAPVGESLTVVAGRPAGLTAHQTTKQSTCQRNNLALCFAQGAEFLAMCWVSAL